MEASHFMGKDFGLKDPSAVKLWPVFEQLAKRNLGKSEKWVPWHTVLGVHWGCNSHEENTFQFRPRQFGGMMNIYCLGAKTLLIRGQKEAQTTNTPFLGPRSGPQKLIFLSLASFGPQINQVFSSQAVNIHLRIAFL